MLPRCEEREDRLREIQIGKRSKHKVSFFCFSSFFLLFFPKHPDSRSFRRTSKGRDVTTTTGQKITCCFSNGSAVRL